MLIMFVRDLYMLHSSSSSLIIFISKVHFQTQHAADHQVDGFLLPWTLLTTVALQLSWARCNNVDKQKKKKLSEHFTFNFRLITITTITHEAFFC